MSQSKAVANGAHSWEWSPGARRCGYSGPKETSDQNGGPRLFGREQGAMTCMFVPTGSLNDLEQGRARLNKESRLGIGMGTISPLGRA